MYAQAPKCYLPIYTQAHDGLFPPMSKALKCLYSSMPESGSQVRRSTLS
jgi:hypothetical protein